VLSGQQWCSNYTTTASEGYITIGVMGWVQILSISISNEASHLLDLMQLVTD